MVFVMLFVPLLCISPLKVKEKYKIKHAQISDTVVSEHQEYKSMLCNQYQYSV